MTRGRRTQRWRGTSILFGLVVLVCLAQVGWWTYYQVKEASRVERTTLSLLEAESVAAAVRLERDHAADPFPDLEAVQAWLDASELPLEVGQEPGPGTTSLKQWAPGVASAAQAGWIGPTPQARASILAQGRSRVRMFLAEGIAFILLVLLGVVILVMALRREVMLREAQDRFLSGTTHELKTPLATLRLGLQSLAGGRVDPARAGRYLEGMLEQVEKLSLRVDDLLAAAESGARGHPVRFETADLRREVESVVEEMGPRFAGAGIAVRLGPGPALAARVDREGMRVVARNLLDNAVKYSRRDGTVDVNLGREGDRAVLTVEDGGIGIPPEEIPRIFDRFYRSGSRETQHRGGTGLGLYLVREIVKAHGGEVTCRSHGEGKGACFRVDIPLGLRPHKEREGEDAA